MFSPRGLGIALLTVCIGIGIWAALIIRKTAAELRATSALPGASMDEATRKRRLLGIRAGQLAIVIPALSSQSGCAKLEWRPYCRWWWAQQSICAR